MIVWFAILCIAAVSFVIYSQENTERSIAEVVEKKEAEPKTKSQIPLTVLRKVFHVLIVCVDVPGLLWDPELVYFSTGVILALFIIVEVMKHGLDFVSDQSRFANRASRRFMKERFLK